MAPEPVKFRVPMAETHDQSTILIVDDSEDLLTLLRQVLSDQSYNVQIAHDGATGVALALQQAPALVVLDVGLPDRSGMDVIRELRARGFLAPVLMLTAHSDVADRVSGLEAGADDYLPKPFDPDELIARIRALLRRAAMPLRPMPLRVGDVELDPVTREARRGGRRLALTQREFALLECLMRNAGRTMSRNEIAENVWAQAPVDLEETNIVDVYVLYLRKKLDVEGEPPMLHTVRGAGYVLRAPKA